MALALQLDYDVFSDNIYHWFYRCIHLIALNNDKMLHPKINKAYLVLKKNSNNLKINNMKNPDTPQSPSQHNRNPQNADTSPKGSEQNTNPYDSENLDKESDSSSKDITEKDIENDLIENDPSQGFETDIDTQNSDEAQNDSFQTIAPEKGNPVEREFEIGQLGNEELQ